MRHTKAFREKAIRMREKGLSLKEISEKMGISKSTASLWFRNLNLNKKAQERLKKRQLLGYYKTQLIRRKKREKIFKNLTRQATKQIAKIKFDKNCYKLLCALLYWAEGTHSSDTQVKFTNSDSMMISAFLKLLRESFRLDEKKFRALVHIHEYHDEIKQKKFWSKITKIPLSQFHKSYCKPNTKKEYEIIIRAVSLSPITMRQLQKSLY
ncbi:MAG TPA: helix-turn-helix domain-containing protein [Nevskiaceae bacterium]|nr:helix-turn-helix domain-containing protein [Nevskiaceae bacterium]